MPSTRDAKRRFLARPVECENVAAPVVLTIGEAMCESVTMCMQWGGFVACTRLLRASVSPWFVLCDHPLRRAQGGTDAGHAPPGWLCRPSRGVESPAPNQPTGYV